MSLTARAAKEERERFVEERGTAMAGAAGGTAAAAHSLTVESEAAVEATAELAHSSPCATLLVLFLPRRRLPSFACVLTCVLALILLRGPLLLGEADIGVDDDDRDSEASC